MKRKPLMAVATVFIVLASVARSADYQVNRSLQLPVSSTEVWRLVGDFCDIDDWHPEIVACDLKVIDGRLHRVLTTTAGAEILERRIAAEPGLSYTYRISASPLPIDKFTATFSIEPGEGARVDWSARFSSDDPATETAIAELFDTGLSAIEGFFIME